MSAETPMQKSSNEKLPSEWPSGRLLTWLRKWFRPLSPTTHSPPETTDDLIRWGEESQKLLENEAFNRAFSTLMQQQTEAWYAEPTTAGREVLHYRVQALQDMAYQLNDQYQAALVELERRQKDEEAAARGSPY